MPERMHVHLSSFVKDLVKNFLVTRYFIKRNT